MKRSVQTIALILFIQTDVVAGSFFNNLLYQTSVCTHRSSWCGQPPCDKPIHPPVCAFYTCNEDDSGSKTCHLEGSDSACQSNDECMATVEYCSENSCAETDYYDDEDNSEAVDGDYSSNASTNGVSTRGYSGGSDGDNSTKSTTSRRTNFGIYLIVGAIVSAFVIAALWKKKNQSEIENKELEEELGPEDIQGSVARRMDSVEAGGDVPTLDQDQEKKPKFFQEKGSETMRPRFFSLGGAPTAPADGGISSSATAATAASTAGAAAPKRRRWFNFWNRCRGTDEVAPEATEYTMA